MLDRTFGRLSDWTPLSRPQSPSPFLLRFATGWAALAEKLLSWPAGARRTARRRLRTCCRGCSRKRHCTWRSSSSCPTWRPVSVGFSGLRDFKFHRFPSSRCDTRLDCPAKTPLDPHSQATSDAVQDYLCATMVAVHRRSRSTSQDLAHRSTSQDLAHLRCWEATRVVPAHGRKILPICSAVLLCRRAAGAGGGTPAPELLKRSPCPGSGAWPSSACLETSPSTL